MLPYLFWIGILFSGTDRPCLTHCPLHGLLEEQKTISETQGSVIHAEVLSSAAVHAPSQTTLLEQARTMSDLQEHIKRAAESPLDTHLQLEVGMDYIALAGRDQWHFLSQAKRYFEKAYANNNRDPIVLMYLGRAEAAQALNVETNVYKRLKAARAGFQLMDRAVTLDSECVYLRLLRAESQLLAHPILRRTARLQEDSGKVKAFMEQPDFLLLNDYLKAKFHLFMGNYLEKTQSKAGSHQKHWQTVATLAPDTDLAKEANARLLGHWVSLGYTEEP